MALSLFSGARCNSLWDPLWSESAWQPFELVHSAPADSVAQNARAVAGVTKVECWQETGAARVFEAELSRLKMGEIKVELEDDRNLSISGERSHAVEKKDDAWDAVERCQRIFLRTFKLSENAQADSLGAKLENGALNVAVQKVQPKIPDKGSIGVA